MSSPRLRITAILLSCLLTASCGDAIKKLGDLARLQAEIVKEYGEKEVGVNLVDDTLTITFINSPLNDKTATERAKRAQETATLVSKRYPPIQEVGRIWVGFIRQTTRLVVFHYAEGLSFFAFDQKGVPLRRPSEVEPTEQYSTAAYVSTLKQTDIMIRSLQLEGDLTNGLSVTPHYTVPGNITAAEPSNVPPKFVTFDFSSSSDKSMFPGAPKVTFLADKKIVYQTEAQFSTSKFGDKFYETLALPVPYATFIQLTSGKTLTLRMGDREYEFSRAHLNALLELRAYVKEKDLARPAGRSSPELQRR
jgi:hypothetical protein